MTQMLMIIDALFDYAQDGSYACIRYSDEGMVEGVCLRRVREGGVDLKEYDVHLPLGTSKEEALEVAANLYNLYILSKGVQS